MRLLLDTYAFIRWHRDELRPAAVETVQRADVVFVSSVSAWEIGIKHALRKLDFPDPVEDVLPMYGFVELPTTARHGDMLRDLPLHHRDPFDRLLIAQALDEGLTILTSDHQFEPYRVPVVWA